MSCARSHIKERVDHMMLHNWRYKKLVHLQGPCEAKIADEQAHKLRLQQFRNLYTRDEGAYKFLQYRLNVSK